MRQEVDRADIGQNVRNGSHASQSMFVMDAATDPNWLYQHSVVANAQAHALSLLA